jgi:hypothetical protein
MVIGKVSRIKPLLIDFRGVNNLTLPEMRELIDRHFEVMSYDADAAYDVSSTVFVCNQHQYGLDKSIIDRLIDDGYKVVFDNLLEGVPVQHEVMKNRANVLQMICIENQSSETDPDYQNYNISQSPTFIWIHDSRVFRGTAGDNQALFQDRTYSPKKKFLLLMRSRRIERDYIVDNFKSLLNQNLYTYLHRDIALPEYHLKSAIGWDRSVNIEWYNDTAFSIAVETAVNPGLKKIFVTEKTYKPIQLGHPFMTIGCQGTLDFLRHNGFETFDNWFDESYDQIENVQSRINRVMEIAKEFDFCGYDDQIMQKLIHNHCRFYDQSVIQHMYDHQVIMPILEFLEKSL